jgi:hypothetical protein
MRTPHRKDSRSRRRSAPDTATKALTPMDRRFSIAVLFLLACGLAFGLACRPGAIACRRRTGRRSIECKTRCRRRCDRAVEREDCRRRHYHDHVSRLDGRRRLIDVGDQPSPFVSEPKLDGTFLWKSQTEGVFTVTASWPKRDIG